MDKDTWKNIARLGQYCECIMRAKALQSLDNQGNAASRVIHSSMKTEAHEVLLET